MTRIPVEERLFSLVLALLATEPGLTKNEILSSVQGYRQRYSAGGDNSALERQFERDKDDIRDLGVPLETLDSPDDPGNNQTLRYRIPKGAYDLPAEIAFTRDESALLGLAAMVWREGEVAGESRRAAVKLRGRAPTGAAPVLGYQPRVRMREAAFEPLRDAIDRRRLVRFPYLNPGRTEAVDREVIPLALLSYQGRWLLAAQEPDSRRRKNFLLRRIVGSITPGAPAPEVPGDIVAETLAELEQVWRRGVAVVQPEPESDAARRLAGR
ncbi:MAG: WYL domain-containing protein, partial [Micrococcales bacterium]|nr:WYL domain-containing protein [Micrococcales bacterium]